MQCAQRWFNPSHLFMCVCACIWICAHRVRDGSLFDPENWWPGVMPHRGNKSIREEDETERERDRKKHREREGERERESRHWLWPLLLMLMLLLRYVPSDINLWSSCKTRAPITRARAHFPSPLSLSLSALPLSLTCRWVTLSPIRRCAYRRIRSCEGWVRVLVKVSEGIKRHPHTIHVYIYIYIVEWATSARWPVWNLKNPVLVSCPLSSFHSPLLPLSLFLTLFTLRPLTDWYKIARTFIEAPPSNPPPPPPPPPPHPYRPVSRYSLTFI